MSLTTHQDEKLNESLEILKTGNRLLIAGSAGVGKTFMVNELVKKLIPTMPFKRVVCSAPTNKAVSVIKGKVDDHDKLSFATVHSSLKIKRQVNYKTGAVTFKPNFNLKNPPMKGVGLFIIDEASMLNKQLLKFVEEHADKQRTKVIFLGDDKQLNPVGEDNSPVFSASYPTVTLSQIVRQGEGNPIIKLSRELSIIDDKEPSRVEDMGYIYTEDLGMVVETLAAVNGTDKLKYLAWTNKEVELVNKLVRRRIYGETPKKVEPGETLIFNSSYQDMYYTNQELKVETTDTATMTFNYPAGKKKSVLGFEGFTKQISIKVYQINVTDEEFDDPVLIVHEDSEKDLNKLLGTLKSLAKSYKISWQDYFNFVEKFADVTYNHAITVHKSQGSTYEQVIVNVNNLKKNRNKTERARLLYTAITRASRLLILYKT
jgi:exodeoxyribonuclease-5